MKPTAIKTNNVSTLRANVLLTWSATGGSTNVVEAASSLDGPFSTISPDVIISGSGETTTSYLDVGALTNTAARFYRIRLTH